EMRVASSGASSPVLTLPLDSQTQLVSNLLNVLLGVASTTFPLNQSVQFDVRPGVCVSGASPESVSRLLGELAQYGTYYLRLSRFSLQSADKKGLVFQAFTGALRKYLHYYRACVLSTPPTLSLLTIGFLFRKVGRQLRYLSELCCVDGPSGSGQATFPTVRALLSPTLFVWLSSGHDTALQKFVCTDVRCPPFRFVSDWVYSGVFGDVYGEFMIQVNEEYLSFRDKHFWVQGYTLISKDVEDCVPVFLRHIANDVYVCGKTINLLKICCPQHYICWSELPAPRIAVTFSLQEVEEIERECAVYRGRMERIAKHSATSREEQALRAERARQELINQVRESAAKTLESIRGRQVSQRLAEEAKKRERFEELKQHLEQEQEWRSAAKKKQEENDFSFARELRDREKRLQALEEQLEQRARKELIAQYSRLSEEAARRERRAMWRAQRMRLDEAREQFLKLDGQKIQVGHRLTQKNEKHALLILCYGHILGSLKNEQQADIQGSEAVSPPLNPSAADPPLISEDSDICDLLPKSPKPGSQQVDKTQEEIGSDLPNARPAPPLVDYDFSAPFSLLEGIAGQASALSRPRWGPAVQPELMHNPVLAEDNVSEVQNIDSFPLGQGTQEEDPNTRVHKQRSQPSGSGTEQSQNEPEPVPGDEKDPKDQSSESRAKHDGGVSLLDIQGCVPVVQVKVGELVSDGSSSQPSLSTHGHSSDAHMKVGQYVSEVTGQLLFPNVHGHASDSHIKIGEHMSEVSAPAPFSSVHGHSSDAHIRIGDYVSEFSPLLRVPNVHGHVSDGHIKVGGHVSDVEVPLPSQNVHGHSSDAHIKVGENVSDVAALQPAPSIHGHSSDANIKVGEFVSNVADARPRWSKHGHASDCVLQPGCAVSGSTPASAPLPGSSYGHSSDSALGTGCVVQGDEPKRPALPGSAHGHSSDSALGVGCLVSKADPLPSPLPGSAYGHSSDSSLGVGCLVSKADPLPSPLPGSAYGHSSDSALGGGCTVLGSDPPLAALPGSAYGHSSDSSLGVGCVVRGKEDQSQEKTKDKDDKGSPTEPLVDGAGSWTSALWLSPGEKSQQEYLMALCAQYQVEHYEDCYNLLASSPESQLLRQVTRGPWGLPMDPTLRRATDTTAVQLSEMVSLPVLIKHSVTTPLITHVSLVNKAVVDYFFVELGVERHFEALRHFLLMEDGEFAQSLSDLIFEKMASGQTPGELLTPLVLNSILSKALQYSLHGDTPLASSFTFALRFLPETFHPLAPDSLNCLELRYKVRPSLSLSLSLTLVKGAGRSLQFHQLQLYRHEMQHFVKVIQGYIANQILQVSWTEFKAKLATASDLDAIHRTHADYLNRAIFRGLLTEKAAPVMNIIHSIFSLILKFRAQLIAQPWDSQQGEAVHPSFIAMQQSYNTFKYYSHFLFKVVTKLVNRGYQPHLEDFLLRINFNNYYKDS
uniref:Tubulin gamma complex associated protein 6 n=1 Tax=Fundulus heteroclitus TaxID=8078 RepID=A0A3Q2NNJ8_FUNHE